MGRALLVLSAALSLMTACGGPSGNDFSIEVTAPPTGGAIADHSYIIQWSVNVPESYSGSYVNVYADTDTDPSAGLVMLAESLDVETTGWLWDCSTYPEGEYFVRAVLHHGTDDTSDYSDGTITITHSPLGDVQGIEVVADSCSGNSVYISWEPLVGATSYRVYFSADSVASWILEGETEDRHFVHDAPGAGAYGVKGVREGETSPGYGAPASTMPLIFADSLYTIWDQMAPPGSPTAVQFTPCGGILLTYESTLYSVYCYQAGQPYPPCLWSGDAPPVGSGFPTGLAAEGTTPSVAPGSGYADSILVEPGEVLFAHLQDQGYFVKVLVDSVPVNPDSPDSRGVSFTYEFQNINGLRLFTSAAP